MIAFNLTLPPSVNNLFKTVSRADARGNMRAVRVASQAYIAWRNAASAEIMSQRVSQSPKRIGGSYEMQLTIGNHARTAARGHRRDLANFEKAVSDLLVHMNVIDDDHLAERILLQWGDVEGCRVELSESRSPSSPR